MRRIVHAALVLLIVVTHGCNDAFEPVAEEPLPSEDLGTLLTSAQPSGNWWGPRFAWTLDGAEILHVPTLLGPAGLQLLAVNVSDQSTRVVADIAHDHFGMLRISHDGETVIYSAFSQYPPPTGGIYQVTTDGAGADMLVDNVGTSFAISPDGSSLAYVTAEDSLHLLNIADGSTRSIRVEGRVGSLVGLSPDDNMALHGGNPKQELRLTSLLDGSTLTIWSELGYEHWLLGLRWEQGEIQILFAQSERLLVRDMATGADRLIATLPGTASCAAWSSDGALVAAWVPRHCVGGVDWFGRCTTLSTGTQNARRQYTLHLIDATTGGAIRQIGQGNFLVADQAGHDEWPTDIAFSPDGRRIAYLYRQSEFPGPLLYVIGLP